jgi:hypothetical protein
MPREPTVVDGNISITLDNSGVIVKVGGKPKDKLVASFGDFIHLFSEEIDGKLVSIRHNVYLWWIMDGIFEDIFIEELTFDMKKPVNLPLIGNIVRGIQTSSERMYDKKIY